MKTRAMRKLAVVLAVAAALGTAGGALACDRGGSKAESARSLAASHHSRGLTNVVTGYLGLTRAQILTQLKAGKSLADIANATSGKSGAGLVDAIVAAVKVKLDRMVAAGRLTQAREDAFLARVRDRVTAFVNKTWSFERHNEHRG